MKVIGITGGSGCGKTEALDFFRKKGAVCVDADKLYHALLERDRGLNHALISRFPAADKDGKIDRAALSEVVFSDPAALHDLNAIAHRYVLETLGRMIEEARAAGKALFAVDAAALFESGLDQKCDLVIAVTAPRQTRLARIMRRDGLDEQKALKRIEAQHNDDYYMSRSGASVVNNSSRQALDGALTRIYEEQILRRK